MNLNTTKVLRWQTLVILLGQKYIGLRYGYDYEKGEWFKETEYFLGFCRDIDILQWTEILGMSPIEMNTM